MPVLINKKIIHYRTVTVAQSISFWCWGLPKRFYKEKNIDFNIMGNLETINKEETKRLIQVIENFGYDERVEIGILESKDYSIDFYDKDDDMYYYENVGCTEQFLCFINDDLVYYQNVMIVHGYKPIRDKDGNECDKEESIVEYTEVIGKNNEIDEQLGVYIEDFDGMDEIEEYFNEQPKFLYYIKTNLMSWVNKEHI